MPRNKIWKSFKNRDGNDKLIKNIQTVFPSNVNYVMYENMKSETGNKRTATRR